MDAKQVARELAEEIRTNSALRHRLGMEEGTDSGLSGDGITVEIDTKEGAYFITVEAC